MEQKTDIDMMEDDTEDMDIGGIDLDKLEKAVQDPEKGVIPSQQVFLLKEAIIKTRKTKSLGVGTKNSGTKIHEVIKKSGNERRGRRSKQQRIKDIGEKLVTSRKFPTIEVEFVVPCTPSQ